MAQPQDHWVVCKLHMRDVARETVAGASLAGRADPLPSKTTPKRVPQTLGVGGADDALFIGAHQWITAVAGRNLRISALMESAVVAIAPPCVTVSRISGSQAILSEVG